MDEKKLFGKRIAELRKIKGLTQLQLAELIDVNVTTLAGIEQGEHFISWDTLSRIKDILDVKYKELFDFEKEEEYKNAYLEVKANVEYLNEFHPDLMPIAKVFLRLLKQK